MDNRPERLGVLFMGLRSISYCEYDGDPRRWQLERTDFEQITLVVGRNATGKTRMLKVIAGLCAILAGKQPAIYDSGTYEVDIEVGQTTYHLEFEMKAKAIVRELLTVDGVERLRRGPDGIGKVYYEREKESLDFQVPTTVMALQQRSDEIQHPFIVQLVNWARAVRFIEFASGGSELRGVTALQQAIVALGEQPIDVTDLLRAYTSGFTRYKEPFDAAIIKDMGLLGYDIKDVSAQDMRQFVPVPLAEPLIGICVTEREGTFVPQVAMSQGMTRALSLVVQMNVALFGQKTGSPAPSLLLIDDIGEGLDYGRSTSLIDMIVGRCRELGTQLIMATNDRFVMNRVPLENWALLKRSGSVVKAHTPRNSAEQFERFKFIGLSNFDFFTSETFE